ncbi:MAG TPA: hypothetical protein VFM50_09625 [Nocardioidaceae bacterium]|nr:hypothetical protein [Nocardioidaceae bacterium]
MTDLSQAPQDRAGSDVRGTDVGRETPDPGRFGGQSAPGPRRKPLEVLGAAAGLLALVVGVPALLIGLGAPSPIPTGLPDRDALTQPITTELLLTVLVAVVWLTWLFFVVCVVVEVAAALRGGLARPIPLGGPLQQLARVLVGTLIIGGVLAGPANAATVATADAQAAQGHRDVATATVERAGDTRSGPAADAGAAVTGETGPHARHGHGEATHQADGRDRAHQHADGARAGDQEGDLVDKKVYTVKAPKDGYHDNLWDIAERHLGDGRRYHEIFRLNQDRVQPDGRTLDLARLIQPGWTLVMPADAVGVPRVSAPEAPVPADRAGHAPGDARAGATDGAGGLESGVEAGAVGGVQADAQTDAVADPEADDDWAAALADHAGPVTAFGLGGAGLLAAGLVGALIAQRRRRTGREPDPEAAEVEEALRVAATRERASWLDRAVRELAATCLEENVPLPGIVGATVDEEAVELMLAPPRTDAPSLWEPVEEGRRWRRTDPATRAQAPVSPYPALVSLGLDEQGRDVLVDLEAAGGVVSIQGAPHVAAEVAAALAVQTATNAWSDSVAVTATKVPGELEEVGDRRIRVVGELDEVLPELESRLGALRQDVLSGRMSRRGSIGSHLLVCGSAPDPALAERLAALTGSARQALSVVVAGATRGARWQLRVDESGVLTLPALHLTVVANRVSSRTTAAVAELFAAARTQSPDTGDQPALPAPGHEVDDAAWSTAVRRIGVLGRLAVQGPGALEPRRQELAEEMVTFLALHPEGVHPNVLAAAVWPRGVPAAVRDNAIERVRGWLGTGPEGHHYLRSDAEGRLLLADDVVLDWDVVLTLLQRARRAPSSREERDLLRRALQLVRDEPFTAHPEHRYGWLARAHTERTVRRVVTAAARRQVELCRGEGDHEAAAAAAVAGLRIDPAHQPLWRDLLSVRHASAGAAGVHAVLDEMGARLGPVELDPETEALIEELLPDDSAGPVSSAG